MRFYALLAALNVACFLPLYLLNLRSAPNPFQFLRIVDRSRKVWPLELFYARYDSTDPFRINFDFTFFVLLVAAADLRGWPVSFVATALLAVGFVEIQYTAVMHSIFKRPPATLSDWSLLRSGMALAQKQIYWMVPAACAVLALVWLAAGVAVDTLLAEPPESAALALALASLLVPPLLFHCVSYSYAAHVWRVVYSPALHFALGLRQSAMLRRLYSRDAAHYERHNYYRDVTLGAKPNIVIACVESYGSAVYRDPAYGEGLAALLRAREAELAQAGYRFASTFSDAPLFAGGSWLSYSSLLYGTPIDTHELHDALFSRPNGFGAYESLFHVLRRNGYDNVLLCPLGGVDLNSLDWAAMDRCFQPQQRIFFDDLDYVGPCVNYLGIVRRYSPLDQYSLNFGYEAARGRGRPFSLFFCTLNSHYPWHTVTHAADDWRSVNTPGGTLERHTQRSTVECYAAAIRYQLDYLLRFARDRAADDPVIVLFGDHQPPMITPERMGKQTPVHVISRNRALVDVFLEQGFAGTLDLTGREPAAIRHEGFLSLFMRALQQAHGARRDLEVPYRAGGAPLFEPTEASVG